MRNRIAEGTIFQIVNGLFLIILSIITIYPPWHVISISFSSSAGALKGGLFLWPREFNFTSYGNVLSSSYIWTAFKNSAIVTVFGTVLHVLLTAMTAYPLNKTKMPGVRLFLVLILFTMLFGGGLIPTYMLVKSLHLIDTLWALILPGMISAFNVIVIQSFMRTIPEELEESATMDGANTLRIFFTVILPLCMPVLVTVALWEGVGLWNNYMQAMIYLNDKSLYTLPLLLKQIIAGQELIAETGQVADSSTESVVAATIVVSMLPIMAVYPFLQKFFMKGTMLGTVKA